VAASAFKVAVVGAGPGGFYAAGALLKNHPATEVSLIERLAAPFGLVRYGVAPDHASLKSVAAIFERTGRDPRVTFFGNTRLWRDVSLEELMAAHHAVILAIGAPEGRDLAVGDVPPQPLYSAAQMVGWYNSHPDHAHFTPQFGAGRVCIFGHGNVAVDVARILLCPPDRLVHTDISQHSLELLRTAPVREVHLVGRRGPAQTRFSAPVIAELLELPGVETVIDASEPPLTADEDSQGHATASLAAREVMRVLETAASRPKVAGTRRLLIHFWSEPKAIAAKTSGLEVTLIRRRGAGRSTQCLRVDAAVTATGFQLTQTHCDSLPLNAGALSNQSGRMLNTHGAIVPGLYAVGWAARGANGTIGTCRSEAERLIQLMLADASRARGRPAGGSDHVRQLLNARQHRSVNFEQWTQLDRIERANGAAAGRSRLKFPTLARMLASLDSITAQNPHRIPSHE
jgi:ferredoxin--NADP+ reductase